MDFLCECRAFLLEAFARTEIENPSPEDLGHRKNANPDYSLLVADARAIAGGDRVVVGRGKDWRV